MLDELRRIVEAVEDDIDNGSIVPEVTPDEIRNHIARYDFAGPLPLEEVTADVRRMMRAWHVQVTHRRYLGLFNPSVTFPSIVGDMLTAVYNPQLATWRTSPAANEIERHVLLWFANQFGLPENASACFTSGGSEANLSAVIVALVHAFPEFREQGLRSLRTQPTVYATSQAHHALSKFMCMTGLGQNALRIVGTDSGLRMDVEDLAARVDQDRRNGMSPFLIVATAGTTAAGAIDPLPEVVAYCRNEGLWCHIDAAWGGAAVISPKLRHHLDGIGGADSITCDAHKWLSVPMGAGMFFCRHPSQVYRAFNSEISFMPARAALDTSDPYSNSVQWSRRFIGLKLFVALANLGQSGYSAMIERQALLADLLREELRETGWRIVNSTPLPLVCFTRDGLEPGRFVGELQKRQIAWISQVTLGEGTPVLRACITSIRTTGQDIRFIVNEMNALVAASGHATAVIDKVGCANAA